MSGGYVNLIGAEDVRAAAASMRHAADEMQRAASQMQSAFEMQQRFMDDWLARLESVLGERR